MKTMKRLFAVLICTLMCMSIFAVAANAAETAKPIKQTTTYRLQDGKWVLQSVSKSTYKKGVLKQNVNTSYSESGGTHVTKYVYGKNKTLRYYDGKLECTTKDTVKNGLVVKSVDTYSDGKTSTSVYTYDKKGNNTKTVVTGSYGDYTSVMSYNKKGYMTKEVTTGKDYTDVSTYTYNKQGYSTGYKSIYTYKSSDYSYSDTYDAGVKSPSVAP